MIAETALACRACASGTFARTHLGRDMVFGKPGSFAYAECAACGSLSLENVPDLAAHYPDDYYSMQEARTPVAKALQRVREFRTSAAFLKIASELGLSPTPSARILDVGSGSGTLLYGLARRGYARLVGSDPFLRREAEGTVRLTRDHMRELDGTFDIITFNHALEHVPDPRFDLESALGALAPDPAAAVLVRVPVVNEAWERYGTNWVGLDAPRHLMLATERGMHELAARAGGRIDRIVYDSTGYQFWASELFERDVKLAETTGSPLRSVASHFFGELRYGRAARRLNATRRGDAAAFLIRRA